MKSSLSYHKQVFHNTNQFLIQQSLFIIILNSLRKETVMTKVCILLVLTLLILASPQQFLPKGQSNHFPVNDLHSKDIARSGKDSFWKVDQNGWSVIISAQPVRPNAVTKVTFYMQTGDFFIIGCGMKDIEQLKTNDICQMKNGVEYYTPVGSKCKNSDQTFYASRAFEGDNITMTIDLRPQENSVSFAKNGLPMGIAYSGLNEWGQNVYIMFGIYYVNHRLKIIDYAVVE